MSTNKPWNKRNKIVGYRKDLRPALPSILIMCEGNESFYFQSFPVANKKIKTYAAGRSKLSLIEEALKEVERNKKSKNDIPFEQIWCVFDMDFEPNQTKQRSEFDNAIKKANNKNIRTAWSNDCIELWYLLHFKSITKRILRNDIFQQLKKEIGTKKNIKSAEFCGDLYKTLLPFQKVAFTNISKIRQRIDKTIPHHQQNPHTTVDELVIELNKSLRSI